MPATTPISQLQAAELLTSIDGLSADIDHLTIELRKTNLRATRTTIVAVIGVAAMLFTVWVALGNRQTLHEAERARLERSEVTCVRANIQIKVLSEAIGTDLPYRDCSPAGIAAYFDSTLVDPATASVPADP